MQPHIGDQVYIRPRGQVLDAHGREVPATGLRVAWSEFWQHRLEQGDVEIVPPQAAVSETTAEEPAQEQSAPVEPAHEEARP